MQSYMLILRKHNIREIFLSWDGHWRVTQPTPDWPGGDGRG